MVEFPLWKIKEILDFDFDFVTALPGGNLPAICIDFVGNVMLRNDSGPSKFADELWEKWMDKLCWQ